MRPLGCAVFASRFLFLEADGLKELIGPERSVRKQNTYLYYTDYTHVQTHTQLSIQTGHCQGTVLKGSPGEVSRFLFFVLRGRRGSWFWRLHHLCAATVGIGEDEAALPVGRPRLVSARIIHELGQTFEVIDGGNHIKQEICCE